MWFHLNATELQGVVSKAGLNLVLKNELSGKFFFHTCKASSTGLLSNLLPVECKMMTLLLFFSPFKQTEIWNSVNPCQGG